MRWSLRRLRWLRASALCVLGCHMFAPRAAWSQESPAPATPSTPPDAREPSPDRPAEGAGQPPPPPPAQALPPLGLDDLDDLRRDLERFGPPAEPTRPVYELDALTVTGKREAAPTPASAFEVDIGELAAIPRKSAADHLMLAPGVLTTNTGGEGHAQETFMRGFAAGEGKDIEFLVDGVPVNDVSNPHTHGYAELYFVPPEVVEGVDVAAGPFDPVQGDFAFAGTARYRLGVVRRGSLAKYGYGSFDTHRALLLVAPSDQARGTFGAFEYMKTDGYGSNRAAQRAVGMGRYAADEGDWSWSTGVYGLATRYDQAGVVRQDDDEQGEAGFFATYDPNQGGESKRLLATFSATAGPSAARFEQVTYLGLRSMRLRENFTGWTADPLGGPGVAQRGDGLELRYDVLTMGHRGQMALREAFGGLEQAFTAGWSLRYDRGTAASLRLRSVTGIPYARLIDRSFDIANLSGWVRAELRPLEWLSLRGGARIDAFLFGVTDYTPPDADRDGERVDNQVAQSMGYAINPRASLEVVPVSGLSLTASYGQGTRSTEAAALSDNETAPFARSQQVEAGARYEIHGPERSWSAEAQLAYVYAEVTRDLLFDEAEGRNVLIGSTTRHALLLGARLQVGAWFDALLNVGWAQATVDATGERLPYIPSWVVRADAAASGPLFGWTLGGVPVQGRVGLGLTFVPGRPLPFDQVGDAFWLVNLGGELRLWHTSLGFEIRNLLDRRYRQTELNYASNFASPDAPPSRLPVRHFVAGEPLTAMATLTLHVEDWMRSALGGDDDAKHE